MLARRAVEIVGRVDAADAELASLVGLRTGRVRVGAFSSALSVLVPPAAAELRRRHPNLELELTDGHPRVALQQLRDGEIDLAIVFRYDDEQPDDDIRYTHLLDDPIHLLSRRTDAGFTPHIAFTSDDIIVEQAFVAAGLGVTTMPGLALRSHLAEGVRSTELPIVRRIHVATYGEPPDPPATEAFVAALKRATLG